jgi:hypothetical protein
VKYDTSKLLHWFDVVCKDGSTWPVYLGIGDEVDDLRGNQGLTIGPPVQIILIDVAYSKREQDSTLFHEKAHAATWKHFLEDPEGNERAVVHLEKNLYTMARQCGWRAPPRPDGYERMRRRAMRINRKAAE